MQNRKKCEINIIFIITGKDVSKQIIIMIIISLLFFYFEVDLHSNPAT